MFEYLKVYLRNNHKRNDKNTPIEVWRNNLFDPVFVEEIVKAEEKMGQGFPSELRKFYEEIGYGNLTTPHIHDKDYDFVNSNMILPPETVACFYLGQLEDNYGDYYMAESTHELLEPGDLPFFEIGDSCRFLYMKLNVKNPNAVWALGNIKIEDSFEKFIWRLYYEDPGYYDDIIEKHYQ